jgi:hypothetical protein
MEIGARREINWVLLHLYTIFNVDISLGEGGRHSVKF